jgi:lysophospholipase L1-like esterase
MRALHFNRSLLIATLAFTQLLPFASAQRGAANTTPDAHWVATWAAAQQQPNAGRGGGGRGAGGQAPTPGAAQPPAAAAAAIPAPAPAAPVAGTLNNQTARMIVRTSIGGSRVRVEFSNAFGTAPLDMGAAHIAIRGQDSAIIAGSDRPLLFNGKPAARVLPGAVLLSDPVDLVVPRLGDLAISVYVPGDSGRASQHSQALHTTYIATGDTTGQMEMADARTTAAWYWISSVDVMAPADAGAIVAFGDSITDGTTSTVNANRSWPSLLAERLMTNPATSNLSVLNLGIAGNRVLGDGAGVSALARFDRDVLSQPGVKYLMILEGINDMNGAGRGGATQGATPAGPALTADDLIGAMKQMIERAHTHGIKAIGCTLTPYGNATDAVEALRQALNQFIRTGGAFDGMVDFDKVIQDPNDPRQFRQGYNNTDKLHPNDAGYKAMADAVDLSMFVSKAAATPAAGPARR